MTSNIDMQDGRTNTGVSEDSLRMVSATAINDEPISDEDFDALVADTQPLIDMVDSQAIGGVPMTFFEVITALAYEAFAQAPVDVAVVEGSHAELVGPLRDGEIDLMLGWLDELLADPTLA